MKCQIPQISWHGRDPVLSIDFQMCSDSLKRLATGGTDSHVLIWYTSVAPNKCLSLEFASDLNRHNKPVNVVRFSPKGEILASGDDESIIILWKLSDREINEVYNEEENSNKEQWYPMKVLRGHLDDVCDLSWSPDSNFLLSGSVDNTAIIWDILKGKKVNILSEYGGFVQGVTWDPQNQYLASLSSDRILRIHNLTNKKVIYKVQKASIISSEKPSNKPAKLFYDDTLKSFCRRLCFSIDGELLIVPSGIIDQEDGKFQNTTYVFTRGSFSKPVLHLPTGSKYTLAARCSPILYKLREQKEQNISGDNNTPPLFDLPYRLVYAIATEDSVLFYDTQQPMPFALVSNIHYTHLTDLAWSPDGQVLVASSTDGYCSFIIFNKEEIGEPYVMNNDVEENCNTISFPTKSHSLADIKNVRLGDRISGSMKSEKSPSISVNTVTDNDLHVHETTIDPNPNTSKNAVNSRNNSIKSYLSRTKELQVIENKARNDTNTVADVEIMDCDKSTSDSERILKKKLNSIRIEPSEKISLIEKESSESTSTKSHSMSHDAPVGELCEFPLKVSKPTLSLLGNKESKENAETTYLEPGGSESSPMVEKGNLTAGLESASSTSCSNLFVSNEKSALNSNEKKPGRRIQLITIGGSKRT